MGDSYKLDYDKVFGDGNKKLILGIIVLAVIIYGVWQGYGNSKEDAIQSEKKSILTELDIELSGRNAGKSSGIVRTDLPEGYITNKCSSFPRIEGEISCENAVSMALTKYGGYAYYVEESKQNTTNAGKGESTWIVGINSETQIAFNEKQTSKLKVVINKKSGDMQAF